VTHDPLADQASLALNLAREDPKRAEILATGARDLAIEAGRPEVESSALRALGLAARALHRIPGSLAYLTAAVEAAERAGDLNLAAEARSSLAATQVLAGAGEEAMLTLGSARATGQTAVVVASQRAAILSMLGRYEEARQAYTPVISGFRRLGDRLREARALNNRGLLYVYTGRFAQAEADLAGAERIMLDLGNMAEAASFGQNRGFAAARKGDLPTALALFEDADRRCQELGVQPTSRSLSRADALAAAGLFRDARRVVDETLSQFRQAGDNSDLAEGLVLMADVALLDDDPKASRAAAEEADRLFELQQSDGWAAVARAAIARAALAQGDDDAPTAAMASEAARRLDEMGLVDRAVMAHAVAGRIWLAAGGLDKGLAELALAGSMRGRGTAAGRLAAWEALGVERLERGDRRGAMAAMHRALMVVEDQRASLGATELRAQVAVHARTAAQFGLRLAVESRRATCIWQWMERHRANSLRPSAARPPRDGVLASFLTELRGLAQEISTSATKGVDPAALLARQRELERRVRERAWETTGTSGRRGTLRADPNEMSAALGEAALVELGETDGFLHVVTLAGGRWRHRRLAPSADVRRELGHLRLALSRLAYGAAYEATGAEAGDQLTRAAESLDRMLLAPIANLLGSRPVVVVPTGELHAVPWAALPSVAGRAVSVAPSSRLWLGASAAKRISTGSSGWSDALAGTVVVAGPGLPGAEHEAAAIGSLYTSPHVLRGPDARVLAVTEALEGAGLAHIAAHSHFRADNGLWSSLELADGPLTVYELEQLRHPPAVVVLSACRSGMSAVRPGDEVMGLVAALLGLGTRAVVASLVPLADRGAEEPMVAFHRRLRAGDTPPVALAAAQSSSPGAASLSYVCFGGS
jgi:tetratricopeptide (TPR) repeat protein